MLRKLRGMLRDYEPTLSAYTVMSNHIHLLPQAPGADTLACPLRWFLPEAARAFHPGRPQRRLQPAVPPQATSSRIGAFPSRLDRVRAIFFS